MHLGERRPIDFMQGNEASTEGAIDAGLRFFAGYPITPSTEIAERLVVRLPQVGGVFLQMEDELACISAIIGASWTGVKSMTATSGPGFSLMQESIGYAAMTETPIVIAFVMRGGPSTGQPTRASQADIMQIKWGSHGDYQPVALAPYSVQECYDLTVEAFNMAEKYRVPTMIVTDAEIAHMRGQVRFDEEIEIINRKEIGTKGDGGAYDVPDDLVPPFPTFGHGHKAFVTGMTHDLDGHIAPEDGDIQAGLVRRLNDKILSNRKEICKFEVVNPDADVFIIGYGSATLAAKEIAMENRDIGLLRLKTVWPIPEEAIMEVASHADTLLMVEMNMGQIFREVQRLACICGCADVRLYSDLTGDPPRKSKILKALGRGVG